MNSFNYNKHKYNNKQYNNKGKRSHTNIISNINNINTESYCNYDNYNDNDYYYKYDGNFNYNGNYRNNNKKQYYNSNSNKYGYKEVMKEVGYDNINEKYNGRINIRNSDNNVSKNAQMKMNYYCDAGSINDGISYFKERYVESEEYKDCQDKHRKISSITNETNNTKTTSNNTDDPIADSNNNDCKVYNKDLDSQHKLNSACFKDCARWRIQIKQSFDYSNANANTSIDDNILHKYTCKAVLLMNQQTSLLDPLEAINKVIEINQDNNDIKDKIEINYTNNTISLINSFNNDIFNIKNDNNINNNSNCFTENISNKEEIAIPFNSKSFKAGSEVFYLECDLIKDAKSSKNDNAHIDTINYITKINDNWVNCFFTINLNGICHENKIFNCDQRFFISGNDIISSIILKLRQYQSDIIKKSNKLRKTDTINSFVDSVGSKNDECLKHLEHEELETKHIENTNNTNTNNTNSSNSNDTKNICIVNNKTTFFTKLEKYNNIGVLFSIDKEININEIELNASCILQYNITLISLFIEIRRVYEKEDYSNSNFNKKTREKKERKENKDNKSCTYSLNSLNKASIYSDVCELIENYNSHENDKQNNTKESNKNSNSNYSKDSKNSYISKDNKDIKDSKDNKDSKDISSIYSDQTFYSSKSFLSKISKKSKNTKVSKNNVNSNTNNASNNKTAPITKLNSFEISRNTVKEEFSLTNNNYCNNNNTINYSNQYANKIIIPSINNSTSQQILEKYFTHSCNLYLLYNNISMRSISSSIKSNMLLADLISAFEETSYYGLEVNYYHEKQLQPINYSPSLSFIKLTITNINKHPQLVNLITKYKEDNTISKKELTPEECIFFLKNEIMIQQLNESLVICYSETKHLHCRKPLSLELDSILPNEIKSLRISDFNGDSYLGIHWNPNTTITSNSGSSFVSYYELFSYIRNINNDYKKSSCSTNSGNSNNNKENNHKEEGAIELKNINSYSNEKGNTYNDNLIAGFEFIGLLPIRFERVFFMKCFSSGFSNPNYTAEYNLFLKNMVLNVHEYIFNNYNYISNMDFDNYMKNEFSLMLD